MTRGYFEKLMISNDRIACEYCGTKIWEDKKFDVLNDGDVICENCHNQIMVELLETETYEP